MGHLYLQTAAGNAVYIDESGDQRVYTLERRTRRAVAFRVADSGFLEQMARDASQQIGQLVTWRPTQSIEP